MKYLLILMCFFANMAKSQHLMGTVSDKETKSTLPGATVYWLPSGPGVLTDENGKFHLAYPTQFPSNLVVSYVGYKNDTIQIESINNSSLKIKLAPNLNLKEVKINQRRPDSETSLLETRQIEILSSKELLKAACCNLAESFQTNATVDVNASDAVSGANKISMLGLDGSYVQILQENIPTMRGIASSFGMNYIPGPWLESIQITKGSGSVVNGYESTTGQLNLELLKPNKADKFYLNLYADRMSRFELNTHFRHDLNKKINGLTLIHAETQQAKWDFNKDGFLDAPLNKQINIFNRWLFNINPKWHIQSSIKGLVEERQGGQTNFVSSTDRLTPNSYGYEVNTKQLNFFGKIARLYAETPYKGSGLMITGNLHQQDAYIGLKTYSANQKTFYANLVHQNIHQSTTHKYKTGASFMLDDYNEKLDDSTFTRREIVPGVFYEYNYSTEKWNMVAGLRSDFHNLFGTFLTPRMHAKYSPNQNTSIRYAIGKSMRYANVIPEQIGTLASSRNILISQKLMPERAWNTGVSYQYEFKAFGNLATFLTDYFITWFDNQVVADFENPRLLQFYNLKGKSVSHTFQTDLKVTPIERFDIRFAIKVDNPKTTYGSDYLRRPYISNSRAILNLAYATWYDKWKFDFTTQYFGERRLPNTSINPQEFQRADFTPAFVLFNSQVTKKFKYWEMYLGAENMFGYKQNNPIIDPQNPFGNIFDASMIWGPIFGGRFYTGIRLTLK